MSLETKRQKRSFEQKLDEKVEKIVYKIMTNDGLEETIVRGIKKALIELLTGYFIVIVILVIATLGLQSIFIKFALENVNHHLLKIQDNREGVCGGKPRKEKHILNNYGDIDLL